MDSVYEAAIKHADKLQTELKAVKAFIELHEHFRDRLGFGAPAAAAEPVTDVKADAAEEGPSEPKAATIVPAEVTAEPAEAELRAEAKEELEEAPPAVEATEVLHETALEAEPEVKSASPVLDAEFEPKVDAESPPEAKTIAGESSDKTDTETVESPATTEGEVLASPTFQEAVSGVLAKAAPVQVATANLHAAVEPIIAAPTSVTGYTV